MTPPKVEFLGDTLIVDSRRRTMPNPIDDAFALGELIILLFAPDSIPGSFGQFPNLVAIDSATGQQVWQAELPTSYTGDRYYKISSHDPLVAYSVKSFVCTIDPATGRVVDKEFVK